MRTEKKVTEFSPEIFPSKVKGQTTPFSPDDSPKPKVPPRMKKKGPALPEKPPHLRSSFLVSRIAPTQCVVSPSQQTTYNGKDFESLKKQQPNGNEHPCPNIVPLKSSPLTKSMRADPHPPNNPEREVLVAASRTASRDRPVERRQREPAKLLPAPPPIPKRMDDSDGDDNDTESLTLRIKPRNFRLESKPNEPPNHKKNEKSKGSAIFNFRKNRTPMVLIPRGHPLLDARNLTHMWGGVYPTAYAMWLQNYESGDSPSISASSGLLRPIFGSSVDLRPYGVATGHDKGQQRSRADVMGPRSGVKMPTKSLPKHPSASVASSAKPRSSSVTRSGSLTSHGSTSSDSGNETFPKSVLKKHKRNSGKSADRPEQKKNVTFNAFATVQLMEE